MMNNTDNSGTGQNGCPRKQTTVIIRSGSYSNQPPRKIQPPQLQDGASAESISESPIVGLGKNFGNDEGIRELKKKPFENNPVPQIQENTGSTKSLPEPRPVEPNKRYGYGEVVQKPEKTLPEKNSVPDVPMVLSDRDVLEHTASLWKYKPIPEDEPESYDEYKMESAILGNFRVNAARVRGKKHKHEGTNCDDWFETRSIDRFAVIAVSDGAGSKKFSRIGAKASCNGAMAYLEKEMTALLKENAALKAHLGYALDDSRFQQAASQMAQLAQKAVLAARDNVVNAFQSRHGDPRYAEILNRELQLNDFAATFLLTIVLPVEGSRETFIVTCQVGDGMTAAISTQAPYEQMVTLLGDADSGAFSGETEFLTSSSIDSLQSLMGRTRVARKNIDILMSMTDGVADDYDPNEKEMLRLYLDLLVNRVIISPRLDKLILGLSPERRQELKKSVPEPQSYPSVTKEAVSVMVPIQYVRELRERGNLDLKAIWEEHLEHIGMMAETISLNKNKSEATRLKEWLDNYVVRGSFDDRTLVILQRGGY